jgi:hypothetical protein
MSNPSRPIENDSLRYSRPGPDTPTVTSLEREADTRTVCVLAT